MWDALEASGDTPGTGGEAVTVQSLTSLVGYMRTTSMSGKTQYSVTLNLGRQLMIVNCGRVSDIAIRRPRFTGPPSANG